MTSINERQYQLPFCQVLAAEGETILYVSAHGPFEKGKDVITRTTAGEVRAYQLKAGDIALSDWRQIYGEIVNLVELPVEFAGSPPAVSFTPYLVTNGELKDPVLEQVRAANVMWTNRGFQELHLIQKGELFERFRTSHGAYLPRELNDFRLFLELIQRDGAAPAEKEKAALLFEHILPASPQQQTPLNVARSATSIVLLAAYITGQPVLVSNHWSVFEYWVLAGAYILHLIEKFKQAEADCQVSFELCEMAAERALTALVQECAHHSDLVQGFPLVDGHVYGARVTILVGLLSAWDLFLRIRRKPRDKDDFVGSFLTARLREASIWGESAVPFLFLAALESEEHCRPRVAEGLAVQLIREISIHNGAFAIGRGIPNPYYSPEEALRLHCRLDSLNSEQFIGISYCLQPLIDFLARRWRRQALASLWFGVTRMSLTSFVPTTPAEWFRWKSSDGVLDSHLAGEPQSWESLRDGAETSSTQEVPQSLVKRPAFALWFILVYPHRFTPATAKLIEDALRESPN